MQEAVRDKPGMGVENAQRPPAVSGLPGDAPRGPQKKRKVTPGFRHLGCQITADLYARVVEVARAEGSGTSAFVRRLIADHLGEEAAIDRLDGVRVPPTELAAASVMLGHLTQLVIASRDMADGQAAGAVAALETAHTRLVRILERMER